MPESHVLVVEDDDTIRRLLVELVKEHSLVDVDAARDGVEALHKLSVGRYAVVILDVMMPKMSGVDVLDSLNAIAGDPSVERPRVTPKVIVITSATDGVLPSEAIARKFPEFVCAVFRKPLELDDLAEMVDRHLRA